MYRAGADSAAAREEGFELAQWALQTGAADALAQMSVRFAKGEGPLADLVRERQDLLARRQGEDAPAEPPQAVPMPRRPRRPAPRSPRLDQKLDAIDTRLAAEFKEYAELANPKPLTIAATQALFSRTRR